jgi:nitroreductase
MIDKQPITRRKFNQGASTALIASTLPLGCSSANGLSYEYLANDIWRPTEVANIQGEDVLMELVRFGTLAANSHNTQPWKFSLGDSRISIMPDLSRRCVAVDPDDHHLYASLGCAIENILQAAPAYGLYGKIVTEFTNQDVIHIELSPGEKQISPLFTAIPQRQCTRSDYDGKPVAPEELKILESIARDKGLDIRLFTTQQQLNDIIQYVVQGNSAQMNDAAFVAELKKWIRFSESEVLAHRDGLFAASSGNPILPEWLGKIVFRLAFRESSENDKYRQQILSSAGVMVFSSDKDDKQSWVKVGRSYQRFALQATALGLRHAFVNQAVEVPAVRELFSEFMGIKQGRVDLLVRFGYADALPPSLRRPLAEVIV